MAKPAALDRALEREALALQAIAIMSTRDKTTTGQLTDLARSNNMSLSTLYRMVESYRENGIAGLVRARNKVHPLTSVDSAVVDYVRQFLIVNPSARSAPIINQVYAAAQVNKWKVGSPASLYRLINKLRTELNISPATLRPVCSREKLHQYIEVLPSDQFAKVESYLKYLIAQGAIDKPAPAAQPKNNDVGPAVKQPTLGL